MSEAPLLLASASPRRRALLALLGVTFVSTAANVDEEPPAGASPSEAVRAIALRKLAAVPRRTAAPAVLVADTLVVLDGRLLGKPAGAAEARAMLAALAGRGHEVLTAVALHGKRQQSEVIESRVWMRPYTEPEITASIAAGTPFDKAGGYAIQDPLLHPVARCDGCYCAVMGLPLWTVFRLLQRELPGTDHASRSGAGALRRLSAAFAPVNGTLRTHRTEEATDVTAATPAIGKVADPQATEAARMMGAALQRYLDGVNAGVQVRECLRVSGGFETFIFSVTFDGTGNGRLPLGRPVILRVYHGPGMLERSAWEHAVIARVREDEVPAPAVYLYEPDPRPLGGPFLLLEFVHGRRMDEATLTAKPLTLMKLLRVVALVQTRIYRVEWPEGRRLAEKMAADHSLGPFAWAGDRIGAARADIEQRGLRQLLPIVDWLEEHRRLVEREPDVLIHGDFHPLNVFVEGTKVSGIIDWGAGGFANRHEDLGWSSLLIATATSAVKAEDKQLAPYRTVARQLYLRFLWQSGNVDRDQLRYGEVSAGLRWLMIFLPTYLPNAGVPLLNPDAIAFTTPLYVRRVRRFIEQRTKLTLGIL